MCGLACLKLYYVGVCVYILFIKHSLFPHSLWAGTELRYAQKANQCTHTHILPLPLTHSSLNFH